MNAARRRLAWLALLLLAVLAASLWMLLSWAPRDEGLPHAVEEAAPDASPGVAARAGEHPEPARRVHVSPVAPAAPAPPAEPPGTGTGTAVAVRPRLSVRVRDPTGTPVRGATVQLRHDNPEYGFDDESWRWSARTGDDGAARLEAPMRGHYQVRASHGGRACLPAPVALRSDAASVDVVIGPAVEITGVVLRRNGTAVHDARVALTFHDEALDDVASHVVRGDVDETGRFTIPGVPVSLLTRIDATARVGGTVLVQRSFERDDLPVPPHLVLRATSLQVVGHVVDEAGAPIANAAAVPRHAGPGSSTRWARPSSSGRLTLSLETADDTSRLVVSSPGRAAVVLPLEDTDGDGVIDLGEIVLGPGATVSGRVVREDGSPVPDLTVSLTPDDLDFALVAANTDSDGRFVIPCVGAGPHRVALLDDDVVQLPGGPGRAIVHAGEESVRLVFRDPTPVVVRLVGGNTPRLPTGSWLELLEPVSGRLLAARDVDGRWTVQLLVLGAGVFDLQVGIPGYAPHVLRGVRVGGTEPVELDVPLRALER